MVSQVSIDKFRQDPGAMLRAVKAQNSSALVEENGEPVAALIDAGTFQRLRELESNWKRLRAEIGEAFEGIPEEQGTAMVQAICDDVRPSE